MHMQKLHNAFLQPRSALVGSAGLLPMVWPLEDVSQEHSAGPGCLMEEPGTGHLPGTAWLCLNWPLKLHVTTVVLSRLINVSFSIKLSSNLNHI